MDLIKVVEQAFANEKVATYPKFKAGDTLTVTYRIKEGDKERLQKFKGVVIQIKGASPATKTFTIRKISNGVGVERIFRGSLRNQNYEPYHALCINYHLNYNMHILRWPSTMHRMPLLYFWQS